MLSVAIKPRIVSEIAKKTLNLLSVIIISLCYTLYFLILSCNFLQKNNY